MIALPPSRGKRDTALAMFLQYYQWSFSLLVFHRDLQGVFSLKELKKWHSLSENAHFFTSLVAFRILNEFFAARTIAKMCGLIISDFAEEVGLFRSVRSIE